MWSRSILFVERRRREARNKSIFGHTFSFLSSRADVASRDNTKSCESSYNRLDERGPVCFTFLRDLVKSEVGSNLPRIPSSIRKLCTLKLSNEWCNFRYVLFCSLPLLIFPWFSPDTIIYDESMSFTRVCVYFPRRVIFVFLFLFLSEKFYSHRGMTVPSHSNSFTSYRVRAFFFNWI